MRKSTGWAICIAVSIAMVVGSCVLGQWVSALLSLTCAWLCSCLWAAWRRIEKGVPSDVVEALQELVRINEEHNNAIESIIGHPLNWNDSYLNRARAVLNSMSNDGSK